MIPHEERLAKASRPLFVGCGGGFDVFSAIPMAHAHLAAGGRASFANLSFSDLAGMEAERIGPAGHVVAETLEPRGYFPELLLRRWLLSKGFDAAVHGLEKTGVAPLSATLAAIVEREDPDVIVVVDGGTDSLMKGDEADLATVVEDAGTILAVASLRHPAASLACLGFGIDRHHGVCHHSFLENTAEAIRRGGYLGCTSATPGTPASDAFLDLVAFANAEQPFRPSIVTNSIASSLRGAFGDDRSEGALGRTKGSSLFINPLMGLYWCYDLEVVASMMGFAEAASRTATFDELTAAILDHHAAAEKRPWTALPL